MLLLIVGTTIELGSPSIASLAWFVPPAEQYRQLRGTYGIGRFGAAWRFADADHLCLRRHRTVREPARRTWRLQLGAGRGRAANASRRPAWPSGLTNPPREAPAWMTRRDQSARRRDTL